MCPRTDILDHCRPAKEIQNTQFFLDDVKQYFPDSFLKRLNRVDFCGNFGDPCIARDFYKICEFFISNYKITIKVSTNGAMRSPAWWQKLGTLFANTDSWLEFHIDGLRDTNRLYRIGANWDKIMANAQAFISGGARTEWYYILFKHNQHQVGEAKKKAREMGFDKFVIVETGRFPYGGTYRYMHPDGDWRDLEQATISVRDGIQDSKAAPIAEKHEQIPDQKTAPKAPTANIQIQKNNPGLPVAVNGIGCKSAIKNRFFLDSQGS
jgi:hypothetical protein